METGIKPSIVDKDAVEKIQTIIPRKAILELIKLLDETDNQVEITISKNPRHL